MENRPLMQDNPPLPCMKKADGWAFSALSAICLTDIRKSMGIPDSWTRIQPILPSYPVLS